MAEQTSVASDSEARDLAKFSQDVRNSWKKMLAWWVITAVCFGIRSGIKSDWNLIFLYSGVLTVLPALWFTFVVVICGIPVVVAKLPEPWRPLANLVAFLLWASIPLCGYIISHPEDHIHFGGILSYPGIHGYFVALLFILGIYAFGKGRHEKIPSHCAIEAYIWIPVMITIAEAILVHALDLQKDGDYYETITATGLSQGLVWYFWGVAAASIGLLLGRVSRTMISNRQ